jgi:photosystem II stability/assembly factor-like uncharacterized protein
MNRAWYLPVLFAAAACASVPPPAPPARPQPVPDHRMVEPDGRARLEREEWFLRQRQGADGTVPVDAFARAQRNWLDWSRSHPSNGLPDKAAGSALGGRVWTERGPRNIAGRVLSVAFDPVNPDVIWAGSAGGGLWRSGDFGQTWRQKGGDHLPSLWIGALAVDPRNPGVLYMGTGDPNTNLHSFGGFGGLLKTTDGGETFQPIPIAESAFFRTLVSAADSNLVLTAAKTGLYRSADAGGHFAKTLAGEITDFVQDPTNPSRFVAVRATTNLSHHDSGLFESLDAGATWQPLPGTGLPPPIDWGRAALAFPPTPSPLVYLALNVYDGPVKSSLFRSTDNGKTWAPYATEYQKGYVGMTSYGAHLYLPFDDTVLVQANGNSVIVSRDGGLTWTRSGGDWHVDTHGAAFYPHDSNRVALATDGGVAVSRDGGATFQRVDRGFPTVQLYSCAIGLRDASTLFGGTQDNWMTAYRGDPGGAWEFTYPPNVGDVGGITIDPAHPSEMLAATAYAYDVGFSTDEGRTWTPTRHNGIPPDDFSSWVAHPARSALQPNLVALGGRRLQMSTDGGQHWQPITIRPVDYVRQIVDTAFSPADDREIWTLWSDGKVFVSEDAGATWLERSPPLPPPAPGVFPAGNRISAGPVKGTAYAVLGGTSGARLFRTRDGGATWDDIGRDLPELSLNALLADPRTPGRLFVATDAGVATSGDDGATWRDAGNGLPGAIVFDLCLDPASGRMAAATYGRGLWELAPAPPCKPDATTLCLNGNRFEVKATWATPANGSGAAQAAPLTADTGTFYFFDPANVEAVVKVIDGCGFNNNFWVFAGGLTNLQTAITIRDTRTGTARTYTNPQGKAFQPVQQVDAFPVCDALSDAVPEKALHNGSVSGSSLFLNEDRFKVDVAWQTPDGRTGAGVPVSLTGDTGYFWFFAPGNVELVIKVLRGCAVNGSYWVFAGGLTNVRTTVTVTDTATGKSKTYLNPQKTAFQPIQDVSAFPGCR